MVGTALLAEHAEDDRQSVLSFASTHGTVASLATRLRELNVSFADKLQETQLPEEDEQEQQDDDDGAAAPAARAGRAHPRGAAAGGAGAAATAPVPARRASEDSAAELAGSAGGVHPLHLLHREPPLQPLQVCARLFDRRSHPPLPLRRMSMAQVEDFRQHGYCVLDGLLTRDAAARLKAEAARAAAKGLLQPVAPANLGVLSSGSSGLLTVPAGGGGGGSCAGHASALSSSPCSSTSSHGPLSSVANGSSSGRPRQPQQPPQCGELRMPLVLGQPPADTAPYAPLFVALQELQADLAEFTRLSKRGGGAGLADYALCLLPRGAAPVPRHRDAPPDDGSAPPRRDSLSGGGGAGGGSSQPLPAVPAAAASAAAAAAAAAATAAAGASPSAAAAPASAAPAPSARRVSVLVFLNADHERGGVVRVFPPARPTAGPPSTGAATSGARRSPTSSDAGTTFSELSDCGSLRAAWLGSTTSSVVAEASAPDHDSYSLDGISVADSEAEARQGFEWVEVEGGEMALDVAPLAGRALLVLSGAVEHALLPGAHGGGPGADNAYVRAWCR